MRSNGNIIGRDNRATIGNTRGLWTLPPQSVARRGNRWSRFDQDAATYIAAVEGQDGQELELEIKDAIHNFVIGCKADNIWADIKACAILCGARTLNGALQALVGSNPTNNNFVSGDYDRALGLIGNGTNTDLDTLRDNNSDPQDDVHMAAYVSIPPSNNATAYIGAGSSVTTGATHILGNDAVRVRSSTAMSLSGNLSRYGLFGINRASATTATFLRGGDNATVSGGTYNSQSTGSENVTVFSRSSASYTTARIAFYSVGEATDLVLLRKNVTRLIGAIQGALL